MIKILKLKLIIPLFSYVFLMSGFMYSEGVEFGINDDKATLLIQRINKIIDFRQKNEYSKLVLILKNDITSFKGNEFALLRLKNEMSDIYSYNILDIEKAIEIDESIINSYTDSTNNNKFIPISDSANNTIISDRTYVDKYMDITSADILENAKERVAKNKLLIAVKISQNSKIYDEDFLITHKEGVTSDIQSTVENSKDRDEILSRLLKAEYELYRSSKNLKYIQAYKYFNSKELELNDVFLDEIDFISLSTYFQLSYQKTKDIKYAELALYTIYKPYLNIRDEKNRLVYNSLVNKYINILIDANYKQKRYKEMLYYISLNKSRMIYEDILRNSKVNTNLNIINQEFNKLTGLPKKEIVFSKIISAKQYLDFYVSGEYISKYVSKNPKLIQIKPTAKTRSFLINKKTKKVETIQEFEAKNIYVTYIDNGVIKVSKISDKNTKLIREHLDIKYSRLIEHKKNNWKPSKKILDSFVPFKVNGDIVVSTDKFISKYPLDFFMNKNIIKTTNMFTYNHSDKIMKNINIVGYFNPTLDLVDSEKEIALIENSFDNIKAFKREKATLNKLKEDINRNVLHLSMHGINDAINPQQSMLLFAGSVKKGVLENESLTLKAQDMRKFSQLKDNDLVFTAACETGLTKETKSNNSEIEGILRPLLINNNKNIILTLWQVPDNSAKDFVNYFYDYLSKNQKIKKSFILAKNKLKEKYKSPVDWAPYYLIQN